MLSQGRYMPRRIAIAAAFSLVASVAFAQDVREPQTIGANVARDFWCASAFGIASSNAATAGDEVGSIALRESMTALFQRLLLQMQGGGYSREQYDALATRYLTMVLDPFRSAETSFSREECELAVGEADAALAAPPAPVVEAP